MNKDEFDIPDWEASVRILTEDPLKQMEGQTIHFESFRCPPGALGNFWTNQLDGFGQAIAGIYLHTSDECTIVGTATMVAAGVALTASHVFSAYLPRIESGEIKIVLIGFAQGRAIAWQVCCGTTIPETDITLLSISLRSALPPRNTFQIPHLSLRVPRFGEPVMIMGYREILASATSGFISTSSRIRHSTGLVTEHYLDGRGGAFPGEQIAVACNTPGGVSGGAAFDVYGDLIGILSTSMEFDDGLGPSFVALLPPVIAQEFPVHWLVGNPGEPRTRLLEIKEGFCNIEKRAAITYEVLQDGRIALTYDNEA